MPVRRLLFSVVCLSAVLTAGAVETLVNSEVDARWRKTTIKVRNGGQSPNVVTLLKAFHEALPTWVVGEVLKQNDHPAKGTRRDGSAVILDDHDDDDFRILIDIRNGYADYASMTDVDQMSCCVWRRTDGHRIFAVSLYEQHDPVQHLLCWYDYDPATQTMKAEKSPIDKYKKPFERTEFSWSLPMQGTDFIIHEYHHFPSTTVTQVYGWDGMEHRHTKTQISDFRYQCFGEDDWLQASEQGFTEYALVDLDGSGSPSLCLRKPKADPQHSDNYVVLNDFRGEMQTVTVNDEMHQTEGFFHVKPEADAPWTAKDLVAFTSDFMHTHYYAILQDGSIGYFVTDEPETDDDGNTIGYTPKKNGYGAKDESIHIIHASVADKVSLNPDWKPFEFVEEEP